MTSKARPWPTDAYAPRQPPLPGTLRPMAHRAGCDRAAGDREPPREGAHGPRHVPDDAQRACGRRATRPRAATRCCRSASSRCRPRSTGCGPRGSPASSTRATALGSRSTARCSTRCSALDGGRARRRSPCSCSAGPQTPASCARRSERLHAFDRPRRGRRPRCASLAGARRAARRRSRSASRARRSAAGSTSSARSTERPAATARPAPRRRSPTGPETTHAWSSGLRRRRRAPTPTSSSTSSTASPSTGGCSSGSRDLADGGPVADVGCGPGQIAAHLAAAGADVTGFDLCRGHGGRGAPPVPRAALRGGRPPALPAPDGLGR